MKVSEFNFKVQLIDTFMVIYIHIYIKVGWWAEPESIF